MFFDLSWSHILVFLVIALLVVGPKDLPKVMRKAGQWTAKARGLADQFRSSFDEMARQSELDELRKEIQSLRNSNPLSEAKKQFQDALTIPQDAIDPDTPVKAPGGGEAHPDVTPEAAEIPQASPEPAAKAAPAEAPSSEPESGTVPAGTAAAGKGNARTL